MGDTLTAMGLMSGTSMDGIDAAILVTDGERVAELGPTASRPYTPGEREVIRAAVEAAQGWVKGAPPPAPVLRAEKLITSAQVDVVKDLLKTYDQDVALIGFHGQTVLHRPDQRWTVQIGYGAALAAQVGIDVVANFREADVAAGGQGAPFAPLYHQALVASVAAGKLPEGPVVVVNLGGVGNVTYIQSDTVLAFDTGPANGPIDDWVAVHGKGSFDKDGVLAASGTVDEPRIAEALKHPFFSRPPPKSLDRLDFTMKLAEGLSVEDGAATLTGFSARALAAAAQHFPDQPAAWIICGGGRHNPTLMSMIADQVAGTLLSAEDVGWRGDHLEAEAFAFLAVRSVKTLALSLPTTTGVPRPTCGGCLYKA